MRCLHLLRPAALLVCLLLPTVALAASKYTMPDIDQDENTCVPTAAANLIYWFGQNGYPKLVSATADAEAAKRQVIASLMVEGQTTFRFGTNYNRMLGGLRKFFKARGYDPTVSFRGLSETDSLDDTTWFEKNSHDNTGFILCLAYVRKTGNSYSFSESSGHAVTMMAYNREVTVILDPAHPKGGAGRRTLRFSPVRNASLLTDRGPVSVPVLYEMQGMPFPSESTNSVILMGAICIEMPPLAPPATVGKLP